MTKSTGKKSTGAKSPAGKSPAGKAIESRSIGSRLRSAFSADRKDVRFDSNDPEHKGLVITLCILAASTLWFAFSMQESYIQLIDFPTQIVDLPGNKALSVLPPSSIKVQIEGEGVQVLRLFYNPPIVPIPTTPGDLDLFLVATEAVNNVNIQSVTPRSTKIVVEDRVFKKVPVRQALDIKLESGYGMIGDIQVLPDSVTISGAESIIDGISEWRTSHRTLGTLSDSLDAMIALSDTLVGLVDLEIQEVRVKADIQEFTEAIRSVEVRSIGLKENQQVRFAPSKVDVIFQVPLSQYDEALAATDFYVFVPYSDTQRDEQGLVYPILHAPEGLTIRGARISPSGLEYYDVRSN